MDSFLGGGSLVLGCLGAWRRGLGESGWVDGWSSANHRPCWWVIFCARGRRCQSRKARPSPPRLGALPLSPALGFYQQPSLDHIFAASSRSTASSISTHQLSITPTSYHLPNPSTCLPRKSRALPLSPRRPTRLLILHTKVCPSTASRFSPFNRCLCVRRSILTRLH